MGHRVKVGVKPWVRLVVVSIFSRPIYNILYIIYDIFSFLDLLCQVKNKLVQAYVQVDVPLISFYLNPGLVIVDCVYQKSQSAEAPLCPN